MLLMNEQSLITPSGCYELELLEPVTKMNEIRNLFVDIMDIQICILWSHVPIWIPTPTPQITEYQRDNTYIKIR